MDILKLVDEGERLGLRGQEQRDFVGAQQERERASRALAREIAKQNYDREWENAVRERLMAKESYDRERDNSDRERENVVRERLMAKENVDRERLIAREKFDRENDERGRVRSKQKAEFEIEMQLLEKQIELERMKANNNNRNASYETLGANQKSRMARPIIELPCFDEENDKIYSYLRHFERVASYEGWDIASYPMYLNTLLTGKAREVYCRLPLALANDYRYLKKALLAKYQLTVDDYRRKFFSVKQVNGESCTNLCGDYEEVHQSTTDAYEEETYMYNYTYDDIDSDQFESDDEVSPDNVDREESDTMVETCVSEKQSRNIVTSKPLPVHKHCYVNISHRYLCSPFKEGGLRIMRQLWEKERIT